MAMPVSSTAIYSKNMLTRYYFTCTLQKCSQCGSVVGQNMHEKVFAEYETPDGQTGSLPFNTLVDRYMRLHQLTREQAEDRMPKLPFGPKIVTVPVSFCVNCCRSFFGQDNNLPSTFPLAVPNPVAYKSAPVLSENIHAAEIKAEEARKNPRKAKGSRKIKPKATPEQLRERERLRKLSVAPADDLLRYLTED